MSHSQIWMKYSHINQKKLINFKEDNIDMNRYYSSDRFYPIYHKLVLQIHTFLKQYNQRIRKKVKSKQKVKVDSC